ncbi:MAG: AlkA N-terminal domain-containing protein [Pseudomonadota bacterium]
MNILNTKYSNKVLYRAHLTRDFRFDGKFFVAVKTTKIYCRPVCPARKAKLENLEFFVHATQAEEAGYRPCLRCRPETAPGSPAWVGTSATVRRAVRIMETTEIELLSVTNIAEQLGIGERWFRSLFQQELGTSPQAFLLDRKLSLARNLLDSSSLSITDIALNAGFKSIRRFNDAFKKKFGATPRSFKQCLKVSNSQTLFIRYRPPFDWNKLLNFFKQRALFAMEEVNNGVYQRLFTYKGISGWLKASKVDGYKIRIDFKLEKPAPMLDFNTRVREMFDLDADPMMIEHDLRQDKKLSFLLKEHSGLRIPGSWDRFELAVRAIIGQKISVKATRTVLIRLVELCGEKQTFDSTIALTHFFPTPKNILQADLSRLGLTKAKASTLTALAQAIDDGAIVLDGTEDYDVTCKKLLSIKGIGPWTVQYIAMRALRNPDAFPETDLEIQKQITLRNLDPALWHPWRAYAAILLFNL